MLALGVPAAFAAGLAAGTHCSLMCGPFQALQLRTRRGGSLPRAIAALHGGRVAGYAALGAAAGAAGSVLPLLLPPVQAGALLQLGAALTLLAFGSMQLAGSRRAACCPPAAPAASTAQFAARGLLWALMPCPSLYAMLALAMFSGGAGSGALLLAAFGLGTLPMLGASGSVLAKLGLTTAPAAGGVLIAAGLLGIAASGSVPALAAFCRF